RLGWLLLLFVTWTLTSTVMGLFQDQIHFFTLALFVPLLIGTGGNAGTQATSIIIRAIAVGDVELKDSWRVLWRELRTAILLGGLLAAVALVRALTWPTSLPIALVVSITIFAIVVWADCVGSLLPLLAARLRIDPALVSGPLMSTLVDATGLLIYFCIAAALLRI
ncbi:MAG: magnesium transporter, partial [Anaerolineales bacterium]